MPRKRSEKAVVNEIKIQAAFDGVSSGKYRSLSDAAKQLGLSSTTLYERNKGRPSRQESHEEQQNLTRYEEDALARWVSQLTATGHAPRHPFLREMAEEIRRQRVSNINDPFIEYVTYPPLGQEWVTRFLQRHPNLKTAINRSLELARMKDVSTEIVNAYFEALASTISEHDILNMNVYNMDETGFAIGEIESMRVIVDTGIKLKYQAQPGQQEWVSAVECICADGTTIPPLVIFKGEKISTN